MIHILAYGQPEELERVRSILTGISIQHEEIEYSFYPAASLTEWKKEIETEELLDLLICDVSRQEIIRPLEEARKHYQNARIIPIADASVLPSVYVRPEIFPCALLWRPIESEENRNMLFKVLVSFEDKKEPDVFYISTRKKNLAVPYSKIFYIEARDKKLYLRTEYQEIAFNGTLAQLEEQLGEAFVRCHKGYLVNRSKIREIDWSGHLLQLGENMILPVSKGCIPKLREVCDGTGKQ